MCSPQPIQEAGHPKRYESLSTWSIRWCQSRSGLYLGLCEGRLMFPFHFSAWWQKWESRLCTTDGSLWITPAGFHRCYFCPHPLTLQNVSLKSVNTVFTQQQPTFALLCYCNLLKNSDLLSVAGTLLYLFYEYIYHIYICVYLHCFDMHAFKLKLQLLNMCMNIGDSQAYLMYIS